MVAVVFLTDGSHVAVKIALGIKGNEGNPTGHGVLDVGIQKIRCLSSAWGSNPHGVRISSIDPGSDFLTMATLLEGAKNEAWFGRAKFRLRSPFLRFIRNHCVI